MTIFKKIILGISLSFLILAGFFFVGSPPRLEKITWGVNFSQKHTVHLGLDWKETYLALLDDLGVKNLRIAVHWDLIEPKEGEYNFQDLDWQLKEAENYGVKVILAVGLKTPRWPECHEPSWVRNQKSKIKNQKLLDYIKEMVSRYKDSPAIWAWQVENEPFFRFGECPEIKEEILKKEMELVRALDPQRKIIITDSGTTSFWFKPAKLGDVVGITMYRKAWYSELKRYVPYPFPPNFYWRKSQLIKKFFNKEVICVELQAEPWGPVLLYDLPLQEQEKTMNLEQFQKNIDFAGKTGLREFYLWGGEWWYWLKEKQESPEIWNEARKLWL